MGELISLVRGDADITAIDAYLEGPGAQTCASEVTALRRRDQARLFDKAADARRITLEHFVPKELAALTPTHHTGRNTIATLGYFQRFEKRFACASGTSSQLMGYNVSNARFITPGYFLAEETAGHEEWARRGGVVIDYHRVPEGRVPEGWPAIRSNAEGLQRWVYHQTRDFMRRVSSRVSIGRASRETPRTGDVLLDYWFTLVRVERREDR